MRWFLLWLLLLIAGCGPFITEGTVVNKNYYPAHDEEDTMEVGDITIPITNHIPDRWTITFEKLVDDNTGKRARRTIFVTEKIHDKFNVGDYIFFDRKE